MENVDIFLGRHKDWHPGPSPEHWALPKIQPEAPSEEWEALNTSTARCSPLCIHRRPNHPGPRAESAEQHNTNRSCSHWQERDSGLALPTRSVLLLEDTQSDSTDSSSQHLSSARCQPGYPLSAWSHFHSYPSSPHCSQPSLFSDRYCNCHFLNPTI